MTPQEINVAIAEACGWKLVDLPRHPNGPKVLWMTPSGEQLQSGTVYALPNYLTDLNAMHEAEKVLTPNQRFEYLVELGGELQEMSTDDSWNSTHATAAQRAEAFLRTLNLWTDK